MIQYQALLSSSAVPVSTGDSLIIAFSHLNTNDTTALIRYTQLGPNSELIESADTFFVAGSPSPATFQTKLTGGVLVNVSVNMNGSNLEPGQMFATISLLRGSVLTNANLLTLINGYITDGAPLTFPNSLSAGIDSQSTPNQQIVGGNPGAGVEVVANPWAIGAGTLTGYVMTFTADANAANRRIEVGIGQGGLGQFSAKNRTDITANQVWTVIGWPGPNMPADDAVNFRTYIPLPTSMNFTSLRLTTNTTNLQAADEYTDLFFYGSQQQPF